MVWDLGGLVKVNFFVIAILSMSVIAIMPVGGWSNRTVRDMTGVPAAGPGIWASCGDDSVTPEFERVARNGKLIVPPLSGVTP